MVANKRRIVWDREAAYSFSEAIAYIRKHSDQNADNVRSDILKRISALLMAPEAHPLDKYKINNNGNYRAFELHRYRISYLVKENEVVIVRIRHTSQQTEEY